MSTATKLQQVAEDVAAISDVAVSLNNTKSAILSAIEAKEVTIPVGAKLSDAPALIASIPTGSGEAIYHEVLFVDYDGFVIDRQNVLHGSAATTPTSVRVVEYTYVAGWLDDYSNVTDDLVVFIDRRLIDNSVTRIWVDLETTRTGLGLYVLFSIYEPGTVVIDYGDGHILSLPQDTFISLANVPLHTYASGGKYMITISGTAKIATANGISGLSASSSYTGLIRSKSTTVDYAVTSIFFASNVAEINYFRGHYICRSILFPRTVNNNYFTYYNSFYQNINIVCLIIPDGPTGISALDIASPMLSFIRYPDSWIFHSGANLNSSGFNVIASSISIYTYVRANFENMVNIITGINSYAHTSNIKSLTINASQINSDVFRNNKSLDCITLSTAVRKIGKDAFTNSGIKKLKGDLLQLTHIYNNAFSFTPLAGDLYFSDTAQVNPSAFTNSRISSLRVANFITGFDYLAYLLTNMPLLETLDLCAASSEYIDTEMILRAPQLRAVIIRNITPPTIGLLTFRRDMGSYISFYDVYVPDASWNSYIVATNWVTLYNNGKLHKISEYVN